MGVFEQLQNDVIDAGLCMFCGTCIGTCPSKNLVPNYDEEKPQRIKQCPTKCQVCYEVCPGKNIPMPELDRFVFGRGRTPEEEFVGCGQDFFLAHSTDPLIRINGASGGFVSGILIYALEKGVIDAGIVLGNPKEKPWRVRPQIITTKAEVMETAQSKLSIAPNNALLAEALAKGYKRLGVVALPCQIAGIRKMQQSGLTKKISNSIQFAIGLCCGSNWTYKSVEHIIEEICQVPINEVAKWRVRDGAYPGLWTVYTKDGRRIVLPDSGRRTLSMAFRVLRCSMCYDYSAELADITAGDFFSQTMLHGSPGETMVMIRTDAGKEIVKAAEAAGYVEETTKIDRRPFTWGGFEMKKLGGKYHIVERRKYGHPTPDFGWPMDYPKPMPRNLPMHPHV